jgi:hypothetical protein
MLHAAPPEVSVRLPSLHIALLLLLVGVARGELAAQAMEMIPRFVDFTNEMVIPAETEFIRCTRRFSDEERQIQRRGPGWYRPSSDWDDLLPRAYYVDLQTTNRSVLLQLDRGERPKMIQVRANRDETAGGGTESVTIRFNLMGEPISGVRAIHPPKRRRRDPDTILESPIRAEDAIIGLMLARELAHRCSHGILEPLDEGVIWKRLPIP